MLRTANSSRGSGTYLQVYKQAVRKFKVNIGLINLAGFLTTEHMCIA